ncbi:hypothetical protein H0H81_009698 [Sphagnurus paluster]|uniref:Prenyltransferase alpha-alpha toroid domain-containing protein n=1 Tax=Sphagnurus paluster TaxID=117069 RepID=A0A9P7KII8_9AGAR|nr:hypothetical protein H0H81_009698 [Sphagnurus paluster]
MSPAKTLRPTPTDAFPTLTSQTQSETEAILLQHIPANDDAKPGLAKQSHMQFLVRSLIQGFPARYTSQDASQPWLLFWTIQAFSALQVGLDPGNKQRCVSGAYNVRFMSCLKREHRTGTIPYGFFETRLRLEWVGTWGDTLGPSALAIIDKILSAQHPDGGFGGGPGQAAHLLPTYASVSALAIVGRPGPGGGWDQIDRCANSPEEVRFYR